MAGNALDEEDKAFNEVADEFTSTPVTVPPVVEKAVVAAASSAAVPKTDDAEVTTTTLTDTPVVVLEGRGEFVQLTKAEHAKLIAAVDRVDGYEARIDKLGGTVGGFTQLVTDLRAATPKGSAVEVPDEAFKEMEAEYPEISEHLKKVLKSVKGTGTEVKAGAVDAVAVAKLVKQDFQRHQSAALEDEHPGWRQLVGVVDSDGKFDTANPYRKWLAAQAVEYQALIGRTDNAAVIGKSIDRFKAATKVAAAPVAPAPKAVAARSRIVAAVQPRSAGGAPASTNSEQDGFDSVKIATH